MMLATRVLVLVALLVAAPLLSSQAAIVAFEFTTAIDATEFGLSESEPVAVRFSYDPVRALVLESFGNPAYLTAYGLVDGTLAIGGELLTIHGVASVLDADGLQEGFGYLVMGSQHGASIVGTIGRKPIDEFALGFSNYTEFGMFASTELPSTTDFAALANSAELVFRDTTSGSEALAAFLLPSQAGAFSFNAPEPVSLLGGLAALGALAAASGALRGARSRHRGPAPRRSHSRIGARTLRIGAAALLFFVAPAARAATLLYVIMGNATGSADGAGFSAAPFSIALVADSSSITQDMDAAKLGIIIYESPPVAGSIAIQGVGFGLFSNPIAVFVNQTFTGAGVTKNVGGDLLDMNTPAFGTLDLHAPFGPITPDQAYPVYFDGIGTSIGVITFTSVANVSFEAVPAPEPEAAALAALIALVLLGACDHRVRRGKQRRRERARFSVPAPDMRRHFLAVAAVLAFAPGASAAVFVVDPGAVGARPDEVSITSLEVLGVSADGQTFEWIFVFADGKFVQLDNPFEAGSKRSAANLDLDFEGEACVVPDCVPFQNPIAGTQIMYLLSRSGDPIAGTGLFSAGVSNGTDTAHYNVFAAGDENNPTLTYHGAYYQITMPTVGSGGPLPVVTSATLNLSGAFANAVVPEPAASLGGLLALGALGVLTRRQHEGKRRRRGLRARTAVAALLLVADAPVAAAAGFDLSMPVRSGDRIDGHDVWSVEGLGPDSLNDAAQIAFLDLYVNQISSQGALSSLRRGADVGETIGGLPFTQVNAGYGAAIDGAGTIAFQSLSSGQGQVVFVPPGFASWNLVGNGEFDTDLSDWTNLGVEKTWSEFDDTNDPSSGSLYIRNEREASIGLLAQQCVPVEAGADYSFGYSHFSAGLDADGRAYAGLNWLTGPSCAGASAGYESFDSYTSNVWTRIEAVVTAPAEAHSLQVDLVAMKQVGEVGSLWSVYFDHVRLPEPGAASGGGGALVALLVCARRRRSR
jgi:hypothetical protein